MTPNPSKAREPRPLSSGVNEVVLTSLRQLAGRTFHGQYKLESLLGEGAMGVVFRATQSQLNRQVALKLMKTDSGTAQQVALARFRAETELVANLSHPNIVRLFDSGFEPTLGVYYVSMELLKGMSLADLLDHYRCSPALALEIVAQIASGLTEPHASGVVHRDLKPDNVFLRLRSDGQLQVKILDFGIARALHSDARITQTGVVLGTPAYMAPELSMGQEIDGRTDLYALGIMFYEMLSGDLPFMDDVLVNVLLKHIHESVPPLSEAAPDVDDPALQQLLDRMATRDVSDRFATALELCSHVQQMRRQNPALTVAPLDPSLPLEQALSNYIKPRDTLDYASTAPFEGMLLQHGTDVMDAADTAIVPTTLPSSTSRVFALPAPSRLPWLIAAAGAAIAILASAIVLWPDDEPIEQPVLVDEATPTAPEEPPEEPPEAVEVAPDEPEPMVFEPEDTEPALEGTPPQVQVKKPAKKPRRKVKRKQPRAPKVTPPAPSEPEKPEPKRDPRELEDGLDWLEKDI